MINLYDKKEDHIFINNEKELKININNQINITDKVYSEKKLLDEKVSFMDQ